MRLFCSVLLFALLTVLFAGSALADEMVSLKVGYQMLTPDGTFAVDGNGIPGSPISLNDDLNYDDSEDFIAELALQLGSFRLAASYLPIEFSGSGQLNRQIIFNGQTYAANSTLQSDVKLDTVDIGLTWFIVNIDDMPVRFQLGPEIGVKLVDAEISMTGTADVNGTQFTASEKESAKVPIPFLGARTRIGFSDYFAIVGKVSYLEYDNNSFLDADGQIEFSPIPLVGIYGGYRYFDIDIDDSGIYVDATLDGPYAGAFVRF